MDDLSGSIISDIFFTNLLFLFKAYDDEDDDDFVFPFHHYLKGKARLIKNVSEIKDLEEP